MIDLPPPEITKQVTFTMRCPHKTCGWLVHYVTQQQRKKGEEKYAAHSCLWRDMPERDSRR